MAFTGVKLTPTKLSYFTPTYNWFLGPYLAENPLDEDLYPKADLTTPPDRSLYNSRQVVRFLLFKINGCFWFQ